MKPHTLEFQTKLYRPLSEVFEFFSNAENLNQVTPSDLKFRFLTPMPIQMKVGARIEYRIQLMGVPFDWHTLITGWEPPYRFVDEATKSPYVKWHHEHIFEEKDDHVLMTDRLTYLSPGWILEPLVDKLFVRNQIMKIWGYREERFKTLFGKQEIFV
jgi:ligand-binding SRPBCC domain-containing protein